MASTRLHLLSSKDDHRPFVCHLQSKKNAINIPIINRSNYVVCFQVADTQHKKIGLFTYKQFLPILFLTIATISRDKMGAQSQGNLATAETLRLRFAPRGGGCTLAPTTTTNNKPPKSDPQNKTSTNKLQINSKSTNVTGEDGAAVSAQRPKRVTQKHQTAASCTARHPLAGSVSIE